MICNILTKLMIEYLLPLKMRITLEMCLLFWINISCLDIKPNYVSGVGAMLNTWMSRV